MTSNVMHFYVKCSSNLNLRTIYTKSTVLYHIIIGNNTGGESILYGHIGNIFIVLPHYFQHCSFNFADLTI